MTVLFLLFILLPFIALCSWIFRRTLHKANMIAFLCEESYAYRPSLLGMAVFFLGAPGILTVLMLVHLFVPSLYQEVLRTGVIDLGVRLNPLDPRLLLTGIALAFPALWTLKRWIRHASPSVAWQLALLSYAAGYTFLVGALGSVILWILHREIRREEGI